MVAIIPMMMPGMPLGPRILTYGGGGSPLPKEPKPWGDVAIGVLLTVTALAILGLGIYLLTI